MASSQISVNENVPFICTNYFFISLLLPPSLQSAIADLRWGMPALEVVFCPAACCCLRLFSSFSSPPPLLCII